CFKSFGVADRLDHEERHERRHVASGPASEVPPAVHPWSKMDSDVLRNVTQVDAINIVDLNGVWIIRVGGLALEAEWSTGLERKGDLLCISRAELSASEVCAIFSFGGHSSSPSSPSGSGIGLFR